MAAVLHGSARTTPRIRAELQRSKESTRTLAARYQLNPKTVAKWRARQTTSDAAMGPRHPAAPSSRRPRRQSSSSSGGEPSCRSMT